MGVVAPAEEAAMHSRIWSLGIVLLAVAATAGSTAAAGAESAGSISGRLINDLDRDGDLNDTGEPGLVGWQIVLEKDVEEGQEPLVRETRTGRDGKYVFDNLPAGSYSLSIPCDGQPKLWIGTWPNSSGSYGTNITEDSPDNDYLDFLLKTLDAPPAKGGSIEGKVVWDENRDGVADPSEPGVAGWQVNGGGSWARCFPQPYQVTYTAPDGSFRFDGLMAGEYGLDGLGPSGQPHPDYVVDFPGSTIQSGDGYEYFWFQPHVDVPEDGTGDVLVGVLNVSGTSSISGSIYWDENGNGVRDVGEPLVDCDCWMGIMYRTPGGYAAVDSRVTTAARHGVYSYTGMRGGEYWVALMQPPGVPVNPPAGKTGYSFRFVSVGEGQSTGNIDFGIVPSPDSSLPTVAPVADAGTPTPLPAASGTPVAPVSVGAPVTGDGSGSTYHDDALPAVLALGVTGALALAFAIRRQGRRR